MFYVTFVPRFVPPGADVAAYSFLSGLHVLLTLGGFAILIAATIPLGRLLRRRGLTRALDRLTGWRAGGVRSEANGFEYGTDVAAGRVK